MEDPVSFYDLPAELRELFYIHALTRAQGIHFASHSECSKVQEDISLRLYSASTLTRREALPVVFGKNTFMLDCTHMDRNDIAGHIRKMGKSKMRMMRSYNLLYCPTAKPQGLKDAESWMATDLKLRVLPRPPFYSGSHLGVMGVQDATVAFLVQDMFLHRSVRSLPTNDILDIDTFVRDFGRAWDEGQRITCSHHIAVLGLGSIVKMLTRRPSAVLSSANMPRW